MSCTMKNRKFIGIAGSGLNLQFVTQPSCNKFLEYGVPRGCIVCGTEEHAGIDFCNCIRNGHRWKCNLPPVPKKVWFVFACKNLAPLVGVHGWRRMLVKKHETT